MKEESVTIHDCTYAIPLVNIQEVLDVLPYGNQFRVMFRMLFITGCRIQELDRMLLKNLHVPWLYWSCGKNQHGKWRKEELDSDFLNELSVYRERYSVGGSRLFGILGETFRREFNRQVRPLLSGAWHDFCLRPRNGELENAHVLQLKGLRKSFQTLVFAGEFEKWGDAGVALEFTSKRMKHSSTRITAYHYLENFDALGIRSLSSCDPKSLLVCRHQRRLFDFSEE